VSKLALHGGEPILAASPSNRFVWPVVDEATRTAVNNQLMTSISIYDRSGVIEELEQRLEARFSVSHALLTSSGTAALHSIYAALRLGPDDEVIVPVYTFFATVTPLLTTGATPVFVDCDGNGNLDPAEVKRHITGRTRAIVVTHMWGLPADVSALAAVAKEAGIYLIEDASHAFGATAHGKAVGTFGFASAISLQAQKTLPAGEGGIVLTSSDEAFYWSLAFGHYNKRCRNEIPSDHLLAAFATTGLGLKLRIHPLAAAIALRQLDSVDDVLARRRAIASSMLERLAQLPGIRVPHIPADVEPSWYALVLQYDQTEADGLSRQRLHQALLAEGCVDIDLPDSTRPLVEFPLFQRPGDIYRAYGGRSFAIGEWPSARVYQQRAIKLPVWHRAGDEMLADAYVDAFEKVLQNRAQLLRTQDAVPPDNRP